MGVHPGPCSEPGQDGPRYRQTAFNLRALRGGSDASHAADWILQRTAKVFCITVQNTVQDRTQHNGRDRSWLRDQGLGMTREQCHREALCRLHNMYFVELTWCCCCVSNADAVENNGAAAVLLSRPQLIVIGPASTFESVAHACFGGKAAVSDACQTVSGGTKRESTEQTEQTQQTRDGTEGENLVSRELCSVAFLGVAC